MKRVHLIGIGGTAMATVAAMLRRRGMAVSGSDQRVYPPMSDFLAREGIAVLEGYDAAHVTSDVDLVVIGNAVSRGNPEVEEVLDRKLRYCSLPEVIRDQFLWGARSIVVAGTHGKTTTTALLGWLLADAGRDPTVLVGGVTGNFESGYRMGGGRDFVIEGDEYDSAFFDKTAKFLKYLPDIVIVNNVEFDHADIYADLSEIRRAFMRLVQLVPRSGNLVLAYDDESARELARGAPCPVETFGLSTGADWQAADVVYSAAETSFLVRRHGAPFERFTVPLVGEHNVRNALAAITVAMHLDLDPAAVQASLSRFAGVKRRLELRGTVRGVAVYDDFAHHPTAVAETLRAVRRARPGQRVVAVFEPRSATACRAVFEEAFASALAEADAVLVAPVYRRDLPDDRRLSEKRLVSAIRGRGTKADAPGSIDAILERLIRDSEAGDLVVIMSNGGFENIHARLLAALGNSAREGSA